MRKLLALLMVCFLSFTALPVKAATAFENNMRGVWISTVYGLDYPSTKSNITAQQNEFIEKLDELQKVGINTVFVQVRPKADALYASSINPWSDVLTGVQGKSPGYDPMAFMIEETHKRGMEFHAWLNPYRVTTSGTDLSALSENHPARRNPSWVFSYNNALYYNPELEQVKQHIVDTVKEIVTYYDVDGIHFDDYFYPSSYPLPAGEGKDGEVANARREAVNDMVKRVNQVIKSVSTSSKKSITFGISPPGIWKNSSSDSTGSDTSGRESYYAVFADCRAWIKNGWIDYIAPQIYWQTGHSKADYETLVKWWSKEVSGTNVKLYIGQGIYTDAVATQIGTQLTINQKYSQVKGSIYFSLRDLLNNRMTCKTQITKFYADSKDNNSSGTDTGNSGSNNNDSNSNTNTGSENNGGSSSGGSQDSTVSPIGKTGTVTAASLNIRAGARVDRDIITKVSEGTKLSILDVIGDWYKVKLANGTVGWANSSYIKVETASSNNTNPSQPNAGSGAVSFPAQGTVSATTLNIRAGARVDRDIVAKVTSGTKVTVASELNGWYKVKLANGVVGWASKEYIQLSSASSGGTSGSTTTNSFPRTATVTATALNIRSGARADRPLVTTVSMGTKLTLLDSLGDWYKVKLANGTVGWAIKSYIS